MMILHERYNASISPKEVIDTAEFRRAVTAGVDPNSFTKADLETIRKN